MVGALAFTALNLGILKYGLFGLAPVDDLTGAMAVGGFAEIDPCEEEDPEELPPLIFLFFQLCLYWLGYMCLGSGTISYWNVCLISPLARTPSGVLCNKILRLASSAAILGWAFTSLSESSPKSSNCRGAELSY